MKASSLSKVLRISLIVIFVIGLLLWATLPFLLDDYMRILYDAYFLYPGYRTFIIAFGMTVGVFGLWIIWELIRTLGTVESDPFVPKNVAALKRIGIAGLCAAVLFFGKCMLYVTPLTFVCGIVLLVCSLCAFTLADLFRQAVAYKEENDLTI